MFLEVPRGQSPNFNVLERAIFINIHSYVVSSVKEDTFTVFQILPLIWLMRQMNLQSIIFYAPTSWPLTKTCIAWPADKTVRTGYFPLLKNPSLASICTLKRENRRWLNLEIQRWLPKESEKNRLKTKNCANIHHLLCCVPQVISGIPCSIYLL